MRALVITAMLCAASHAHAQYGTLATPSPGRTYDRPVVVDVAGAPHVLVANRELATGLTRLDWCRPIGATCSWTTIDGWRSDLMIPPDQQPVARVWTAGDGKLHVFYTNRFSGSGVLRHGTLSGLSWTFEDVDGHTTLDGRQLGNMGGRQLGAVDLVDNATGVLAVSYTNLDTADLRVARRTASGWTFATVDGDRAVNGKTTAAVGMYSTLVVDRGTLRVVYSSGTTGVRHASYAGGWGRWATLPVTTASDSAIAAIASAGFVHVFFNFYREATQTGELHHAWSSDFRSWGTAIHDGSGAEFTYTNGATCSPGSDWMMIPYGGLSFTPSGYDLKLTISHAVSPWSIQRVDGYVADVFGRIDGSVGRVSSCTADASRIALVYSHDLGNGQTAVRYGIVPHLASPPEI